MHVSFPKSCFFMFEGSRAPYPSFSHSKQSMNATKVLLLSKLTVHFQHSIEALASMEPSMEHHIFLLVKSEIFLADHQRERIIFITHRKHSEPSQMT